MTVYEDNCPKEGMKFFYNAKDYLVQVTLAALRKKRERASARARERERERERVHKKRERQKLNVYFLFFFCRRFEGWVWTQRLYRRRQARAHTRSDPRLIINMECLSRA
jgi:hypothetical protein